MAHVQEHLPNMLATAGLGGHGLETKNITELVASLEKLRGNFTKFGIWGQHHRDPTSHPFPWFLLYFLGFVVVFAVGGLCYVLSDEWKQAKLRRQGYSKAPADARELSM